MPDRIARLGERLRKGNLRPDDFETLCDFRERHIVPLKDFSQRGRRASMSARIKNESTIVEKLRREKTKLSKMQDIAGLRIVIDGGLREQDGAVEAVLQLSSWNDVPRVTDRRKSPMYGYRAVHLVGQFGGVNIEVQIRTLLQHAWAQTFERLADDVGRNIRYGLPPSKENTMDVQGSVCPSSDIVTRLIQTSDEIFEAENSGISFEPERLLLFSQAIPDNISVKVVRPPKDVFSPNAWALVIYKRKEAESDLIWSNGDIFSRWRSVQQSSRMNDNIEVVLLWSNSWEDAETTHRRYFLPLPGLLS